MKAFSIRLVGASLIAVAVAGCTTTGFGTGQSATGNLGATFNWTETGGARGPKVAWMPLSRMSVISERHTLHQTAEALIQIRRMFLLPSGS